MAGIDFLERQLRSKIFWRSLIFVLYTALSIHEWTRHPNGPGFWLALICAALSAFILRLDVIERLRISTKNRAFLQQRT
ncbi:MAG: hypothetical protein ABSD59_05525 [Terracidiphilus sp.]|jgi:hypothetical protein